MEIKKSFLLTFTVLGFLVLGVAVVSAVTTISTNLATEGNLTVTCTATVTGASTLSSTLGVTGTSTLATTTIVGTTTVTGNQTISGTLAVTGASTLTGAATLTGGATIGSSGTALTNVICVATTTDWAAFSATVHCQWGTTTMTGLTAGADGGWNVSISPVATTSGVETVSGTGITLMAYPTSTNVVEIKVCHASSTDTTNLPAQRYEICGVKH